MHIRTRDVETLKLSYFYVNFRASSFKDTFTLSGELSLHVTQKTQADLDFLKFHNEIKWLFS